VGGPIADSRPPDDHELWQWAHAFVDRQPRPDDRDVSGLSGSLVRVCGATREALRLAGSAVTLMSRDGLQAVAAASDERARAVAALEFDLGEGPSHEAFAHGRPVLASDLSGTIAVSWPGFSTAAGEKGVGAAYALPLQVGASRLGVLSMYAGHARVLDSLERNRATTFAAITTDLLLADIAPRDDGVVSDDLASILDQRTEVFQAQGMVMVALGIDLAEALARMRAHAFATSRDLDGMALDIVEGRLDPTTEMT
jgi:hypothetical protein